MAKIKRFDPNDLPTLDDLIDAELDEPDFVATPNGDAICRHCGIVKEASARFFIKHFADCVKPRKG